MKNNNIKRFKIITDSPEELIIKANYFENTGMFIFAIVAFLGTYIFLYFDIFSLHIIFKDSESNTFSLFLISLIFIPLTLFFVFLFLRSLFFTLKLIIDKNTNLILLIHNYFGYKKKQLIQANSIQNIYISENKTHTTYGLKMSNYTLNFDLIGEKTIRVLGSLNPSELRKLEKLIIRNISL